MYIRTILGRKELKFELKSIDDHKLRSLNFERAAEMVFEALFVFDFNRMGCVPPTLFNFDDPLKTVDNEVTSKNRLRTDIITTVLMHLASITFAIRADGTSLLTAN